jgi:hypothetical protein
VLYASGDTAGFDFVCPNGAAYDLDSLIDDLMDSLTGIAGIADSITAHDSSTYIKAFGIYSAETHGGVWSLDLSSDITLSYEIPNIAMICDSMVAKINAETTTKDSVLAQDSTTYYVVKTKNLGKLHSSFFVSIIDTAQDTATSYILTKAELVDSLASAINAAPALVDTVTATNTGDTAVVITSDKKGYEFSIVPDSLMDTTLVTANVNAWSQSVDTLQICNLLARNSHAIGLYAKLIFKASTDTLNGIGASDSVVQYLYTSFDGEFFLLDSSVSEGLPDTLRLSIPADSAGVDTLLKEALWVVYRIKDSTSDTAKGVAYDLEIDYNVHEQ